jgi:hypothetical protein
VTVTFRTPGSICPAIVDLPASKRRPAASGWSSERDHVAGDLTGLEFGVGLVHLVETDAAGDYNRLYDVRLQMTPAAWAATAKQPSATASNNQWTPRGFSSAVLLGLAGS